MDGVLANFKLSYDNDILSNPTQPYPQSQYGFFLNLKPIEGAIESVNMLKTKFDVWILTRPSIYNLSCYTEKAQWVRNNLGLEMQNKTIICTNKSLLKGRFLIDDQLEHGQSEFEGEHIHFGSAKYSDWNSVTNYLLNK